MSTKEKTISIIDFLSEEQLEQLLKYARTIADIPNDETLEALEEVRQMKKDPSIGKGYTDVDEMMRDLLA